MHTLAARIRERLTAAVSSRLFPVLAGILTAFAVAWMWGGLNQPGAFHDERAYVVQARLLAAGSWTAPVPPYPIFWVMPHVFIEPAIFAKYPPGFAPLLVPGVWLGMQGLIPVLLAGVSASLLVLLVRRLAGVWVAAGSWLLWTSAAQMAGWHASYFSETATVPLYLGALLALHTWLERPRRGALVAVVACMGWIGITRPVTGIALLLPIAVVMLLRIRRARRLEGWAAATLVGAAICAIVPYWSWRTLGSPVRMPYSEYSHEFFPQDLPGFVRDTAPPRRMLPPDFQQLYAAFDVAYANHRPDRIPDYMLTRAPAVVADAVADWAWPAWIASVAGLVLLGPSIAMFVGASFLAMLAVYTTMPHPDHWTLYYLELFPIFATGCVVALARIPRRFSAVAVIALALLVVGNLRAWPSHQFEKTSSSARQRLGEILIAELEDPRAVVFVRRREPMNVHFTLWDILGPPETTPTWIVRDLGPTVNQLLVRRAEGRRPYILDEINMTLLPMDTSAVAPVVAGGPDR